MQPRRLVIPQRLVQRIFEHCREEFPYEACGILAGRDGRVLHAYATDNCAKPSQTFYQVDRAQQEHVLRELAERGEELVGIYHSHPTTAAEPSQNDIRWATYYPDAVRVIISLAGGPAKIRAFLVKGGKAHDVALHMPQSTPGEWHDLREASECSGSA